MAQASTTRTILSADSHITEPPDTYTARGLSTAQRDAILHDNVAELDGLS